MRELLVVARSSFRRIAIAALIISGCSYEDPRPSAEDARLEQEMFDWAQANNRLAGPGKLKLHDGTCLDLTSLSRPWAIDPEVEDRTDGVVIATGGEEFGLRPFELKDGSEAYFGTRFDGRLRVHVTGWSPPNPRWASYWVASPERIEENRRSGLFRPLDLWKGEANGIEAYEGVGNRFYVDRRRLTQCLDYLSLERDGFRQVRCTAISQDKNFSFSFRFDSRDVERLPRALRQIERAIEDTRGRCPTTATPR